MLFRSSRGGERRFEGLRSRRLSSGQVQAEPCSAASAHANRERLRQRPISRFTILPRQASTETRLKVVVSDTTSSHRAVSQGFGSIAYAGQSLQNGQISNPCKRTQWGNTPMGIHPISRERASVYGWHWNRVHHLECGNKACHRRRRNRIARLGNANHQAEATSPAVQ
jgi:hypothetical protein